MKDPYETLGVNRSATDKEIKDAFKKLARKFHPDLHPGDDQHINRLSLATISSGLYPSSAYRSSLMPNNILQAGRLQ